MKSCSFASFFTITLLASCTSKHESISVQTNFNAGLDHQNSPKKMQVTKHDLPTYATVANFETLLKENRANLIVFGMVSHDYSDFEKKYGVALKTENCVISPGIGLIATNNNKIIARYLDQKFGTRWRTDLQIVPFGLD